jgi:kinesin family protein 11
MSDALSVASSQTTQTNKGGCNVQVVVRCRPLNQDEKRTNQSTVATCDAENKMVKIAYGVVGKKIMKNFYFDKVFGMYSRQEEVFESVVRPIVEETLAGFNCTIFAYGQTGTG